VTDCRSVADPSEVEKLQQDLIFQDQPATGVSFISITPDQAAEFRHKRIVYDMADPSAPRQSNQVSTMLGDQATIGLCAHPKSGLVVLSNFDPKSLRDDDKTYDRDRTLIQGGWDRLRQTSEHEDPDLSRIVAGVGKMSERAVNTQCTAKFVELLPSEYALLKGTERMYRVTEYSFNDYRTVDERYKAFRASLWTSQPKDCPSS
jgi:hypothetical protein